MMSPLLTSGFHPHNARVCLEASDWVYKNTCDLVTALCHAQVFGVAAMRDMDDVIPEAPAIMLAFRGSACIRDWITDARFERVAIGASQEIHHGFLDAIISATHKILALLPTDSTPVFVTGHSLGGAMALLAAKVLLEAGRNVMAVYTFGGPRVGNKAYARHYDYRLGSRTWRVVNEEDIVPRIPGVLTGYRHVGREVFLPTYTHAASLADGQARRIAPDFLINPSLWTKLKSDALGTWRELRHGRCAQLEDHRIESYRARLAGSLEPQLGNTASH